MILGRFCFMNDPEITVVVVVSAGAIAIATCSGNTQRKTEEETRPTLNELQRRCGMIVVMMMMMMIHHNNTFNE